MTGAAALRLSLRRPSQCENLVLEAPLELEELVDGEVALAVLSEEEGDEAGVDALKYEWRSYARSHLAL